MNRTQDVTEYFNRSQDIECFFDYCSDRLGDKEVVCAFYFGDITTIILRNGMPVQLDKDTFVL